MKTLSIWQPYASLIAIKAKQYETRGWATKYRGPLLIHAAAKSPAAVYKILDNDVVGEIEKALAPLGSTSENIGHLRAKCLPLGEVIAIANLTDCIEITPEFAASVSAEERAFGDWTPGRYAWKLENVSPLPFFVQAKGQQGIWNFQTDKINEAAAAALEKFCNEKTNFRKHKHTLNTVLKSVLSGDEVKIPEDLPEPPPRKYRADISLYDLFQTDEDEFPDDRIGADVEYFTEGENLETVRDEAINQITSVCLSRDIPAGRNFGIVLTLSCNDEHIDTDEGSATWDGSEVHIEI